MPVVGQKMEVLENLLDCRFEEIRRRIKKVGEKMGVLSKIKAEIKKKDKLYTILLCIKHRNDPDFSKLIKGYYTKQNEYISILISHNGTKRTDKLVYHIKYPDKRSGITKKAFCATLRVTLDRLLFAEYYGMIPVVEWGEMLTFYDHGMDQITKNVFEYYFEPVSGINCREIDNISDVVIADDVQGSFFIEHPYGYEIQQYEIERLGEIYKKYIRLNKSTQEYIDKNINCIMHNGKILGVHARGTDFNVGFRDHPIVSSPEEFLRKTKEVFINGKYDKIFLATDDVNILRLFKKELGESLLFYKDVFRSDDYRGAHKIQSNQPLHYYRLGLEVLRDIYTLANCDTLVCGLSQVSFAARYVNIAINRKYKDIVVLDNGIYAKESAESKKYMKKTKKQNRKCNP